MSIDDAAAVNPNGLKTILANGWSTFPFTGNPVFDNGPISLPKNPPDCPILCNWIFVIFILAKGLFGKALQSLEYCVLVNNNSWRQLFLSLESFRIFDERFRVTPVPFFIADFNLLSCELGNYTFNVLYGAIFIH